VNVSGTTADTATAVCPANTVAMSGDWSASGTSAFYVLSTSRNADARTWNFTFLKEGNGSITVTPSVTCLG